MTRKQKQMIDQFKAGKCLHAASTDNLVLLVQILGPGLKVVAKRRGLPRGECWHLELTDA